MELARSSPEIACVKLEAGAESIAEWVAAAEGELTVFGGNGGIFLLDTLDDGAVGNAPGADVTDELTATYALWRSGDAEGARSRFAPLLPLLVFESQGIEHYNACAKHLLVAARRARQRAHARPHDGADGGRPRAGRALLRRDSRVPVGRLTSRRSSPGGTQRVASAAARRAGARGSRSRSPRRPAGCARGRARRSRVGRPAAAAACARAAPSSSRSSTVEVEHAPLDVERDRRRRPARRRAARRRPPRARRAARPCRSAVPLMRASEMRTMSRHAALEQAPRDRQHAPLRHARAALRARVAEDQHGVARRSPDSSSMRLARS